MPKAIADEELAFGLADLISSLLAVFVPQIVLKCGHFLKITCLASVYLLSADALYGLFCSVLKPAVFTECLFYAAVYISVIFIISLAARKNRLGLFKEIFGAAPKLIFAAAAVFAVTGYYKEFGRSETISEILYLASAAAVIVCILFFLLRTAALTRRYNQSLKQAELQQRNFEHMLRSDEKLRRFRHDYKNHMQVVASFLDSGKTEEAAKYIEEMKLSSGTFQNRFSSGNFAADAVLNGKLPLAEREGIELRLFGGFPAEGIENAELCAVLSNLLDNAVEAQKNLAEKYIKIYASTRNGFFALSVENPVEEDLKLGSSLPKTRKNDKRAHGIGLKNVKKIAENNSGTMLLKRENGVFTADVSLKLKQ